MAFLELMQLRKKTSEKYGKKKIELTKTTYFFNKFFNINSHQTLMRHLSLFLNILKYINKQMDKFVLKAFNLESRFVL